MIRRPFPHAPLAVVLLAVVAGVSPGQNQVQSRPTPGGVPPSQTQAYARPTGRNVAAGPAYLAAQAQARAATAGVRYAEAERLPVRLGAAETPYISWRS